MRTLPAAIALTLSLGPACASSDTPDDASATVTNEAEPSTDADVEPEDGAEADEDDAIAPPKTYADIPTRLEFVCPGPFFALETPHPMKLGALDATVLGSTIRIGTDPWSGPLRIGVIGAVKDNTDETRENLRRANKWFIENEAHALVVNGDLAQDEDLKAVMRMVAEELTLPVFVHAGNIEWAGSFASAWQAITEEHPHVVNANWFRHVDFGGIHLLALPGYHDHRFMQSGACRYTRDDVKELRAQAATLRAQGDHVIVTAHGPPRSKGAGGIDLALEGGNVGDERLAKMLRKADVRFGLFSHILESGGRATADLKSGEPLALPMKAPTDHLYFNVGAASSYPWTMHDGTTSAGLAALFTLEGEAATVAFKKLR